jgi:hypothetical protein
MARRARSPRRSATSTWSPSTVAIAGQRNQPVGITAARRALLVSGRPAGCRPPTVRKDVTWAP